MAPTMRRFGIAAAAALYLATVCYAAPQDATKHAIADGLSLEEIDEQLQTCSIVQDLNDSKSAHFAAEPTSLATRVFAALFPGSPAVNALLATLYISGPPNFLLALCPTDIDPSSLSVMVAFAVGGLLGDTLFHLLPEIFLGEDEPDRVRLVLVEPNRNLVLGLGILVGFMTFVAMDKGLRIATGGGGHDHAHGHGHSHDDDDGAAAAHPEGTSTAVDKEESAKPRRKKGTAADEGKEEEEEEEKTVAGPNTSVKLGGYLNLIADFTHNITDGLAMSASFYASPTIGATTTVAVFFHEIPHEVGDFALLVQSGFSKRAAMGSQFVTAVGALLGTLIGIAVQEFGGAGAVDGGDGVGMSRNAGLWGTSLTWGDMLLPFTAGTFLYVGTVAVIPELLETGRDKAVELRKTLVQFSAVALGAGIMLYISWH
ncbi:solute carrier family 39 (zinc transporter), member 7 [Geosmithia morbida]|uniref:Solute carrier family 39 (Zinc transporter), member 7 n=1 Tax=Geosmithia morbida TaxID=1094350 RepID=A0A9P4YY42_9HYPO|nr:solute carrier family 39 (zinc transporter), member 7 [Geosmithia morbida]KAF4125226.1 solute carrier family 39 (zinc transporter), member 7 [Geosmithia morbida]